MFVPLHTKSEHSPGYGTASVDELLRGAARFGYPAMALTDVENFYGQVKFHHAARALGIKAITGVELRAGYGQHRLGDKSGRLVLLAQDQEGYQHLCRIISHRHRGGLSSVPLEGLDFTAKGLVFLADDLKVIAQLRNAGVAQRDLRFLLGPGAAPPTGVACVADPDLVMLEGADQPLHRLLVAIRLRKTVWRTEGDTESAAHALLSPSALRERFDSLAIAESVRVAERCTLDLCDAPRVLPTIDLPPGQSAAAQLQLRCRRLLAEGQASGRWSGARYRMRLADELRVISELGLAPYFLIVAEIAGHARAEGISVLGRGSAVSSLVAHVLGLTQADPLVHGLSFERFLHSERVLFPDVDLDLPSNRRDEVLEWVVHRFGPERAALISTHQTFRRRGAYREGLKAYGMRPAEVDAFCLAMPPDELEQAELPVGSLPPACRAAVPLIERLVGKLQHLSVHPGGVAIADADLRRHLPLERSSKGWLVTQYDFQSVEKLGLLKIDLLGNRALAAVDEAVQWVGHPLAAADRDPPTLAALRAGNTIGCAQVESPAVRTTLRKLPLRGIADLVAALALVRPGPGSGEAKAAFIRRAHGEEAAQPPHLRLEPLLRETHGMLLYDEDLMVAIAAMTGLTLGQADALRERLVQGEEGLEEEFLRRAEHTGVLRAEALEVWRAVERFAAYSFNKAHATSYAELAWRSTFLKVHHPVELACAVLNNYAGAYPLRTVAADFARNGVRLLAPSVNASGPHCAIESGAVRVGLSSIKHLARKNLERILERRPFGEVRALLQEVPLSRRELRALVLCGACDDLAPLSASLYPVAHEELLEQLEQSRTLDGFVARGPAGARADAYQRLVRINNELTVLDMHLTDHPMGVLRSEATRVGCVATGALSGLVGESVQIAGVVAASRRHRTQAGQLMQFVTLEDEQGLVESVLFPSRYLALGDPVTNPGPFLVRGTVAEDHRDVHLVVTDVKPFHQRPHAQPPSTR
jgi:DNA-directed DNA polymerase III PolC